MPPSSTVLVVRARRALARPATRRLAVTLLGVATALTVIASVGSAGAARDRWGATRAVVVATRDLAPGDVVDAGAVETRSLPEGLLTDAALPERPHGSVVRQPILAGEPVVAARLAPAGLTGTAALVPAGERAVAVPSGPAGTPPLVVGDLVDVVVVLPPGLAPPTGGTSGPGADDESGGPFATGGSSDDRSGPSQMPAADGPAFALVERSLVVDVAEAAVTVAVPGPDAPRVAWALGHGTVVLALAGG